LTTQHKYVTQMNQTNSWAKNVGKGKQSLQFIR